MKKRSLDFEKPREMHIELQRGATIPQTRHWQAARVTELPMEQWAELYTAERIRDEY
jgi:hypothetical protein